MFNFFISSALLHFTLSFHGNLTFALCFSIMAVESKKNETSAEKNVKSEACNGEELVKINGEGEQRPYFSHACLTIRDVHLNANYIYLLQF